MSSHGKSGCGYGLYGKGTRMSGAGIVNWPMSVIRLAGPDSDRLISLADEFWKNGADTRMKRPLSMPKPMESLIIPLPP